MSLPVRLLPEAKAEYDSDAKWYERKERGLGVDFVRRIRQVFTRISTTPRLHSKVYKDVRKATISRFPYAVYYQEEPTEILIVSVFHTSRDPNEWKSRV